MERDLLIFPKDEVGDNLWAMQKSGENLCAINEVEFSVLFAKQEQAINFSSYFNKQVKHTLFKDTDNQHYPWEITAYLHIQLNYESIAEFKQRLISSAQAFQGKYDGWYCVSASKYPF